MNASTPSDDTSILGAPSHEKHVVLGGVLGKIVGLENRLQQLCGFVGGALLIVLLWLVFFSFLSRTMGWTTTFSEEFTRYTVTVIFSFAVGYAALHGKHVCTDFAVLKLSSGKRRVIAILVDCINIVTFAAFAVSAHAMWSLTFQWGMKSNTDIAFPLWIVQGFYLISFFLLILRALTDLVVDIFAWNGGQSGGGHH